LDAGFPPVRRGAETSSRHFGHPASNHDMRPLSNLPDEMEGCDEFEKVTTDDCFEKLVRLRNDVRRHLELANFKVANKKKVRSVSTVFTDTSLRAIAIHKPRGICYRWILVNIQITKVSSDYARSTGRK
jgi:hypothetical protein